ncbi:MAG: DUF3891 family protein [Luteitalea sp.]|nr:DUF3891 family protein [Luteitalea sp.]
MIVRRTATHLLLITQPDHAALAARIMAHWRADGFPTRRTREVVLEAVGQHDIGWTAEDTVPRLDPSAQAPYDFISAPADVRQRIWPRAISQIEPASRYEAALIAQHARTVYRRHEDDAAWQPFLDQMARERDRLVDRADEAAFRGFLQDYAIVAIGDLLSLTFCNGWAEPVDIDGYRVHLRGDVLQVHPDPFDDATVPMAVAARQLPRKEYCTALDLLDAFRTAPMVTLRGEAVGKD